MILSVNGSASADQAAFPFLPSSTPSMGDAFSLYTMACRPPPMTCGLAEVSEGAPHLKGVGLIVFWPNEGHLYVDNIAVLPQEQGKGVGAALLGFVELQAQRSGLSEIRLYTNAKMVENIRYEVPPKSWRVG